MEEVLNFLDRGAMPCSLVERSVSTRDAGLVGRGYAYVFVNPRTAIFLMRMGKI
jgi:hypothetical protein